MAVNHKLTHVKDRVVQDFHLNASTGRFLSMRRQITVSARARELAHCIIESNVHIQVRLRWTSSNLRTTRITTRSL